MWTLDSNIYIFEQYRRKTKYYMLSLIKNLDLTLYVQICMTMWLEHERGTARKHGRRRPRR